MSHHHHHHRRNDDEYVQDDYQRQAQGYPNQGYPGQGYEQERGFYDQGYPGQGYNGQVRGFQQGPPQDYYPQGGYNQGPPQDYYPTGGYDQGPPRGYQPPPRYQQQGGYPPQGGPYPPSGGQQFQLAPNQQYLQQVPQSQLPQFRPQYQDQFVAGFYGGNRPLRRKSLLIGINYTGSKNQLRGCQQDVQNMSQFLISRGYPSDEKSMVVLTDARQGMYYPSGRNILAAMDWLVSEPGCMCFLHYSGHGGQVPDPDGDRDSGFDDTIVPVDFEQNGQITSDTLHRHLVTRLPPSSKLFIVFDCCHSGSAVELPFVYRTDEDGNVNLVDNIKKGVSLLVSANDLIQGGFSMEKARDAQVLFAGAKSLFKSFMNRGNEQAEGLQANDDFQEDWARENKQVHMFSGCRDDQTSADASIAGASVGAMSWALLETMRRYGNDPNLSYVKVLQSTRALLMDKYTQVPQLSTGMQTDVNIPLDL